MIANIDMELMAQKEGKLLNMHSKVNILNTNHIVIFDNVLPDMHKVFLHFNFYRKLVSKEEVSLKMKKLRATKKAITELEGEEKLFYELLLVLSLDKDQKKKINMLQLELDGIALEYKT